MDLKEEALGKAIWILEKCATPNGFYAAYPGYDMVFARDSMIISLGASLVENELLRKTFRKSLETLGSSQAKSGQIPNAVDKWSKRKAHVDFKSLDSSLWFIIGHFIYKERYKDSSLFKKHENKIKKAFTWLTYRDVGEDVTLEQLPTTDWQDAFPHRYGTTIHIQALWYYVLRLLRKDVEAKKLLKVVNDVKDDALWKENFYLPWRWKNHGKYHEYGEWFDTLGNLLAIIYGVADKKKSEKILSYMKRNGVDRPYPVKAIYPTIRPGSKDWQPYFKDSEAGRPWSYLNGGIWTYIGGFYVCALVKMKKYKEAEKQLQKLAEANMKDGGHFAEWLHGQTGKIGRTEADTESYQGWNASMYIAAYESVKKKKCMV